MRTDRLAITVEVEFIDRLHTERLKRIAELKDRLLLRF